MEREVEMEQEIKVFANQEFGQVRVVEKDGGPWFVAVDVCKALDIGNSRMAVSRLDDDEKGVISTDTPGGMQTVTIINEPGLYTLVLGSRKPEAKQFKRWITHEVIPSIRKHGAYATDEVIDKILNNPDFGIQLLTQLKDERAARVEAEKKNAILMHVNKTYTATEIAKELNLKSAQELNHILEEKKIQYKVNNTWVMYSQYSNQGFEEIKQEVLDSGKVVYHRRITQLGRDFILGLFNV